MKLKINNPEELQLLINFITHHNHHNRDNYLSLINNSILKTLLKKLLKKQLNETYKSVVSLEFHEALALYQLWVDAELMLQDYSTVKIMQKMNLLHQEITALKSRYERN